MGNIVIINSFSASLNFISKNINGTSMLFICLIFIIFSAELLIIYAMNKKYPNVVFQLVISKINILIKFTKDKDEPETEKSLEGKEEKETRKLEKRKR